MIITRPISLPSARSNQVESFSENAIAADGNREYVYMDRRHVHRFFQQVEHGDGTAVVQRRDNGRPARQPTNQFHKVGNCLRCEYFMAKEWKISKITLPESIKLKTWPNRRKPPKV